MTGANIIRRCHALILATGVIVLVAVGVRHLHASQAAGKSPVTPEALFQRRARAPKKIRDAAPVYPKLPSGTVISDGRNMWIAEALIDRRGNVVRAWLSRRIAFSPPFLLFDESILTAIKQWKFEPAVVDGQAVPLCLSIASLVDWN